jgi:hypothetical protein
MACSWKKEKNGELEAGTWIETKKANSQAAMLERKLTPAGRLHYRATKDGLLTLVTMPILYLENI